MRRLPLFPALAAVLLACGDPSAAGGQPPALADRVLAAADAGRLDDAERLARDAGDEGAALLGDVLTRRGRLAAADSAYRRAAARPGPDRWAGEVGLAELAMRRGDADEAVRFADRVVRAYDDANRRGTAPQHIAAGRAWMLLLAGDANAARRALAAFDAAVTADSGAIEGLLRVGDLFLDKYNAPDARTSYEQVLARRPDQARALLGLARVNDFEGKPQAMELTRRSLAANPSLVEGHVLLAKLFLEAEAYDSATTAARRALAVDSTALPAWALLGATAWLTGDSTTWRTARQAAERMHRAPADFWSEVADAAGRHRRYADATVFARQAVALDPRSVRALGVLGTNLLRTGDMAGGRDALERAFALDAYHVWHKNTLDLLDQMRDFRVIDRGRFRVVAPAGESDLLAMYVVPLLEQAFDAFVARYGYTPPTPIRLEFFRSHADFSVRTVGLAGLGALGVSFGTVLAMDTPSARDPHSFNWGTVAWHELAHTFTLGASGHRVPRWFSEGLSVLEERRAGRGWGADASLPFLAALEAGRLRPPSQLNDGFVRPRFPEEVSFSYTLASLFCEMVEETRGAPALAAMLRAWRDGADTETVFERVLGVNGDALDRQFDAWVRARYATAFAAVEAGPTPGAPGGAFITAMREATAQLDRGQRDAARATLRRAQALLPDYTGEDAPAMYLARLAHEDGDRREAVAQLARITAGNETAWEANRLESEWRLALGDTAGAMAALERMVWIGPYDLDVHTSLAVLATARGDHVTAIRERRAVLALDPPDPIDARYELARALAAGGDTAGARRELLDVLERAPSFEKAQLLLLELRRPAGTREEDA
jgi:tetratricopeptide (TPR) repeat protein